MKVLHISTTFLPTLAGTEIAIHSTIKNLQKLNVDCLLLVPQHSDKSFDDKKLSYPVHRYSILLLKIDYLLFRLFKFNFLCSLYLHVFLIKNKPDIIHYHFAFPSAYYFRINTFLQRILGIKVVITPQGADIQRLPSIGYGHVNCQKTLDITKSILDHADSVTLMSESMMQSACQISQVNNKKIIPIGTNLSRCRKLRKRYSTQSESTTFNILTVGRNHPKKGFDMIPHIIECLKSKINFKWTIIGKDVESVISSSPYPDTYKYLHCLPPLEIKDINFPQESLIKYYAESDLFMFPTRIEGFALIFLDVMASQLPIVSTKSPGTVDILKHNSNSLLANVDDFEQMADYIHLLHKNKDLADRITQQALMDVENFDWSCIAEKHKINYHLLHSNK